MVISPKQNSRDLYQSATRLFAHRPPDSSYSELRQGKTHDIKLHRARMAVDHYARPVHVSHTASVMPAANDSPRTAGSKLVGLHGFTTAAAHMPLHAVAGLITEKVCAVAGLKEEIGRAHV